MHRGPLLGRVGGGELAQEELTLTLTLTLTQTQTQTLTLTLTLTLTNELQVQRAEQARLQRCMASFEALEASGTRVEAMQRAQRARELVVHRLVLEQKRAALQASEASP